MVKYNQEVVYLIYDGECPICKNIAQMLKIRKSIGELVIINARIRLVCPT